MILRRYTMFVLILLTTLLYSNKINAVTYYVSSSEGDDSNPGTSAEFPWRSLDKVNSFFKLTPGDQILFKRGDSWNGYLRINSSGSEGRPIVYGAYGNGNNPGFYGSEIIDNWTLHTGNIYKASVKKNINQVFLNGSKMKAARFPDESYAYISRVNSSNVFYSSDLKPDINYKGAKWIGRTVPYAMVTLNVSSSNGQTIQLSEQPYSELNINEGFILVGKLEFLDSPGEWFYDNETKTVYLWTPGGDSPNNYEIRGSVIDYGVEIKQKRYLTISNLDLLHYSIGGVLLSSSSFVTIEGNSVINPESRGIYGESGSNNRIENNIVKGASHFGIELFETNDKVTGNKIFDTFLFNNIGISGAGEWWYMGSGIYVEGNDNLIQYNYVFNAGYHGIHFNKRNIVEYNYIKNVMLTKDDGGGIYTSSYNSYPNPATKGAIIRYNIIDGSWGSIDGYNLYGFRQGFGIYLDENAGGVTVEYNTVANCSAVGIGLHKSFNETVRYNTIFNAKTLFNINTDLGGSQFYGNILYALNKSTDNEDIQVMVGKSNGNATINNNTYINHYNSVNIFRSEANNMLNFLNWKLLTNQDANSTIDVSKLTAGEKEALYYNETSQTVTYHLGNAVFRDIYGKTVRDTFSLKPFTARILIGKEFNKINKKPEVPDQTFNIVSPKPKNDTIGVVYATDPDINQLLTYSVLDNTEIFGIHPLTGSLFLITEINTSKDRSFEITVRVTDNSSNSLSDSAKITVHITGTDISPPVINSFVVPDTSYRLRVPITEFIASDDLGVTGYCISQAPEINPADINWLPSPPEYFTFSDFGEKTLYAWTKDSSGNISAPASMLLLIIEPDLSPQSSVYLFEEASGNQVIDSMGVNNGTIVNQVNRTNGANENGVEFSGQGHIDLGRCFGESVKNELSISVWIKPNLSNGNYQPIVTHAGPEGDVYGLYLLPQTKGIEFKTSGTSEPSLIINNINPLWDGEWHHLAVVYNGAEKTIYLDNNKLITKKNTGEIDAGWKHNLFISTGNYMVNAPAFFQGFIDEVRIYNYAINIQQIQALFHPTNRLLKRITVNEFVSICSGQNYSGWSEPGVYKRILKRLPEIYSGADSTVITQLSVNSNYYNEIDLEICEGEIFPLGDTILSTTGKYSKILTSTTGCDSTVVLNLTVRPSFQNKFEVTICEGESYQFNNQLLTETGIYSEKNHSVTGCDSITTLILNKLPKYNTIEEITISPTGNYLGWTDEGTYQRNLLSATGCDSIITTILKVAPLHYQKIQLEKGWNIISSFIVPENENMDIVMGPLRENRSLLKVMDENNMSYEKENPSAVWINKIGSFQITEGYKIKMELQDTLEIAGFLVHLPVIIEIKEGINIISFPFNSPVDAMEVMKELTNNGIVDKIQDEKGNAIEKWDGLGWINGIGNFTPGQGYVIHANSNGSLAIKNFFEKANSLKTDTRTNHFSVNYEGNGFDHMNINITGLNETSLKTGDEIAVFDNDKCVGAIKLTDINFKINAVSIPASASDLMGNDGFIAGNSIELKVWLQKTNMTFNADFQIIKGKMIFEKQASVFLKIKGVKSGLETLKIFPNPASETISILYPDWQSQQPEITVFDELGRIKISKKAKTNPETFNISLLPAGVYFIKITSQSNEATVKFIKVFR